MTDDSPLVVLPVAVSWDGARLPWTVCADVIEGATFSHSAREVFVVGDDPTVVDSARKVLNARDLPSRDPVIPISDPAKVLECLRNAGGRLLVLAAGASLASAWLAADCVNILFLVHIPLIVGRSRSEEGKYAEGLSLPFVPAGGRSRVTAKLVYSQEVALSPERESGAWLVTCHQLDGGM